MHVFGTASEARLSTVHPDLSRVCYRALEICPIDFTIMEGARSDEQCFINFGKGRNPAQCELGGCPARYAQPHANKVTWVNHALSSNHRAKADHYGHAVDIYPYPVSQVLGRNSGWEPLFDTIAKAMFAAAKELGVAIRWGANWDMDNMPRERGETDNPHFELRA
jgi:peptidoglycan L-alanyl-D-glutamate endopeptidase CwlK